MSAGFITRNEQGVILVDMSKQLSQALGKVTTNKSNGTQTVDIPGDKTPFYIIAPLENSQRTQGKSPGVTLTRTSISWNYNFASGFALNCDIYYGYY
ncbi:hypothetical protein [Pseudomonas sp. LD120]|uniref:hypothetical protein n=1 Tax=Pseudomonas sp. LD120 TaxID=485751 RepID=UPI001359BE0E|nr:hypothetical protein [Pseudomonas sp. LD120]KAF0865939.1 hypothetical protein PLD_11895 [Pseudomonas sp. LD120]